MLYLACSTVKWVVYRQPLTKHQVHAADEEADAKTAPMTQHDLASTGTTEHSDVTYFRRHQRPVYLLEIYCGCHRLVFQFKKVTYGLELYFVLFFCTVANEPTGNCRVLRRSISPANRVLPDPTMLMASFIDYAVRTHWTCVHFLIFYFFFANSTHNNSMFPGHKHLAKMEHSSRAGGAGERAKPRGGVGGGYNWSINRLFH